MGNAYVSSPVEARSVPNDITIPSGSTVVHGIYYMWDDQGFTGKGWMYDVSGGPTNTYPDFSSDEDVANYVANNGDLDDVFSYWSQHYSLAGWDAFYDAVGVDSGCMDVYHAPAE